jgi:hypothetical protein
LRFCYWRRRKPGPQGNESWGDPSPWSYLPFEYKISLSVQVCDRRSVDRQWCILSSHLCSQTCDFQSQEAWALRPQNTRPQLVWAAPAASSWTLVIPDPCQGPSSSLKSFSLDSGPGRRGPSSRSLLMNAEDDSRAKLASPHS